MFEKQMLNDQITKLESQVIDQKEKRKRTQSEHQEKLEQFDKYFKNYQEDIGKANKLLTNNINTKIDQIEFNIAFDMVLKQYEEEQEQLMPFDAHGMKAAPQRDIKDMIKDMKEAKA